MTGCPPSKIFPLFISGEVGTPKPRKRVFTPTPPFVREGLYRAVVARCAPTNLYKRANGKGEKN